LPLPSIGQSALIVGATGQVGGYLLKELLASSHFTRVGEFGRRVTQDVPAGKEKLEQKKIDFEKLDEAGLKDGKWDVVFITYVNFGSNIQSFAVILISYL
jgi:oxidoreductase